MKKLLAFILFFMSIANIALFLFWLSLVHYSVSAPDQRQYLYESLSTNITILEAILGIVMVGTGVIAVFWYHSVKDSAIISVRRAADDYLKEKAPALIKQLIRESASKTD